MVQIFSPAILCPIGDYTWQWVDPNTPLELSVRPAGFGNPVMTWVIDGVSAPAGSSSITVTGDVDADVAAAPGHPASSSQSFQLSTATAASGDIDGPLKVINILLTLPDPPPDEFSRFARLIEQAQVELSLLAQEEPETAQLVSQELARTLQVSPRLLQIGEGQRAVRQAFTQPTCTPGLI